VQVHRIGAANRQAHPRPLPPPPPDRSENVGRGRALIVWRRGARAPLGPAARDLVLLADPGFVLEPDLYRSPAREPRADLCQLGCKAPSHGVFAVKPFHYSVMVYPP